MNIAEVRDYALSLPHVTERCPFGPDALALEIGGKIFCLLDLTGRWQFFNLKVDPDLSIDLQDRYPESISPGFHMNKRHWISIKFSRIPRSLEQELIRHAYRQTAKGLPLKVRQTLGFD